MLRAIRTILLVSVTSAALVGCTLPDEAGTAADRVDTSGAANDKAQTKASGGKNKSDAPKETADQANARQSAAQYLDYTAFSRTGLIRQLTSTEGFSKADAPYGVEAQKADWKKQAALSAKQYLDHTSCSRSGLIQQLTGTEGFTQEQAEAGVNAVGL